MCVYTRMFEGENKILAKEGVIHFLELYEVKSLPYSPELSEVMASQLLPILTFIRTYEGKACLCHIHQNIQGKGRPPSHTLEQGR